MKKFHVTASVTISISTTVTAETADDAKRIALAHPMQGFCHSCSGGRHSQHDPIDEWVISGELDGEPQIIGAEVLR